ncbi:MULTISPECIES: type II secretion system protein [unclassified Pseudoalteromonas]|uniref:type II secretion system protein n=1 Tax=unclassified Pseudoalteromonas TaxID=194690 RepID=UPI000693E055|nr:MULTISPECIES: type II secretion system protein [unclassified Pseudoalteromonas]
MSKNTGFTLTELIITIIVLSILSLSALPKFLNLNDDATQASLKGHKAALVDSLALLKGKHIIAGEPNQLVLNGYTLNFLLPIITHQQYIPTKIARIYGFH